MLICLIYPRLIKKYMANDKRRRQTCMSTCPVPLSTIQHLCSTQMVASAARNCPPGGGMAAWGVPEPGHSSSGVWARQQSDCGQRTTLGCNQGGPCSPASACSQPLSHQSCDFPGAAIFTIPHTILRGQMGRVSGWCVSLIRSGAAHHRS